MTAAGNPFAYIFPALMLSIAVVLVCFYLQANKQRASFDVAPVTRPPVVYSVEGAGRLPPPPRYSDVDRPPPYSLFDPRLTGVWSGGPPPAYDLYPITLPLAPHQPPGSILAPSELSLTFI